MAIKLNFAVLSDAHAFKVILIIIRAVKLRYRNPYHPPRNRRPRIKPAETKKFPMHFQSKYPDKAPKPLAAIHQRLWQDKYNVKHMMKSDTAPRHFVSTSSTNNFL